MTPDAVKNFKNVKILHLVVRGPYFSAGAPSLCAYVLMFMSRSRCQKQLRRLRRRLLVFMTFIWNNGSCTDWDVTHSHVHAGV